tara:strand:+ start:13470 stop:14876 length:1407 start_codon:yes stop_codon:yes gene_type:complete
MFILYLFLLIQVIFANPFDGLTLITTIGGTQNTSNTILMDNDENIVNLWEHSNGTASVGYLTKDSILYLPGKITGNPGGGTGGPVGGLFKKIDWNNNIIWEWEMPQEICEPHHDIAIMPNGNFLVICSEVKSQQDAIEAGLQGIQGDFELDMIVEIKPIGSDDAEIIWEWRFWDHLIQDISTDFTSTFGVISEHPELLDINVNGFGDSDGFMDWNHCNKISYNETFDQIVLSSRFMNEIYVIDHSTTTEEASGHSGGNQGKGGDFIYRWGNPQNYDRGDSSNQILDAQHGIYWIPDGYPGAGNFLVFNNRNQINPNRSAVLEFECIADENGFYPIEEGQPYGPNEIIWEYSDTFFSNVQSGAYRLPNGNTIITVTSQENIFEVDYDGNVVWELSDNIRCARALKYGYDYFDYSLFGDMNGDETINILDTVIMVQMILGNQNIDLNGDLNFDGVLNIQDIILIINLIIG